MNTRASENAAESLLARIDRRLAEISEAQHRLARMKAVLQEQATRLRLGAPALEVRLALRHAGIPDAADGPESKEVVSEAA